MDGELGRVGRRVRRARGPDNDRNRDYRTQNFSCKWDSNWAVNLTLICFVMQVTNLKRERGPAARAVWVDETTAQHYFGVLAATSRHKTDAGTCHSFKTERSSQDERWMPVVKILQQGHGPLSTTSSDTNQLQQPYSR
jgi:hypothetical protein